MKNIIFDYDGTLHNSIKIYAPAFRYAYESLVRLGYAAKREWNEEEISMWLGFNSKDMWNLFMPALSMDIKNMCSDLIGTAMIDYINEGKAELYPHSLDVLQTLKDAGNTLIFLSNCKESYMDAHNKTFKLCNYFDDFYCTENYGFKPKYEIFNFIKEKYVEDFIIIGDRYQDIEVAVKHNLYSIGCIYGYGSKEELKMASTIVNNVTQIINLII
jgi:phosphoglycolate phosphatase